MEQNIKRLIIRRCALIALVPLLIVIAGHFLVALLPISPRNTLKGLILIFLYLLGPHIFLVSYELCRGSKDPNRQSIYEKMARGYAGLSEADQ